METAKTILSQLGGNKFIAMTGAKQLVALDNGIRFKIGRNATSTNTVTIELNGKDLYNMKFERVSMSRKTYDITRKVINFKDDVYCDQMANMFTEVTGMYTHL